ncbi:TPA: pertactin-like passenger domain-containing protein [Escherichia coli]|nr:hypothetical protein [Escherichia coli]
MGSDAKNLMSDGNVQIVKTGEVIGATQLTEGELIVEAGGRAENTVVTGAGWLKVATGGIAKCTQYGNNGTLSVSDGAIATDIVQSEGGAISLSTLATVNGTTSAVVVDEGGELLVYPGGEASNCEINQGGVFMLAGKASDTLLAGGTMNNLGGEDSDTIVENGSIYRLGTDGLQLYSSGKTQNLSVNVGGRAEVHAGTLENAVIQGGTVILLSPTSADENFVVEEDRAPVELTGSVALLDGASMIIGYGADLQQSTITVQQGGVLILDGSTVKGDGVTFIVGNINLNGGKLWLITGAATHVQLKVKRLRGEGAICLQTSAKEISPDFINVKGEVTGDIHVEITDASRQTLCNALKLQPDEDGIGATLQPA